MAHDAKPATQAMRTVTTPVTVTSRDRAAPPLPGRLRLPADGQDPVGACVVCGPHPTFGGHLDVWLLPRISEVLAEAGWLVLRFDFPRRPDADGTAETADLAGALDYCDDLVTESARRAVVGWSFGALVGLLHGTTDPRVTDWVGIAPPTRPIPGVPLAATPFAAAAAWRARTTALVGSEDAYFPPPTVTALGADRVVVLEGADHFFFDRDGEVAHHVAESLR